MYIYIFIRIYIHVWNKKYIYATPKLDRSRLDAQQKNEASDPYKVGLHYFEMVDLTHVSMSPLTYRSKPGML